MEKRIHFRQIRLHEDYMIVPTEYKKPEITIINKKLYYFGVVVTWLGVIPTLASIYAHIKMVEQGIFTPEILLNKALLVSSVAVSIAGIVMVNKGRNVI